MTNFVDLGQILVPVKHLNWLKRAADYSYFPIDSPEFPLLILITDSHLINFTRVILPRRVHLILFLDIYVLSAFNLHTLVSVSELG